MKIVNFKFKILLFILSFLILTKFNIDPDLGWHLAYGNEFLETGKIIREDPFSWTMPDFIWGNSYFLYQIGVAYFFENLGYILSTLIFGFLAALAVLTLFAKKLDLFKALAVSIGVVVASTSVALRPHTISFLFFAALLILLEKRFFNKRLHVLFWFLFFLLWANLHRGFLVGLLVFGVYLAADYFFKRSLNAMVKVKFAVLSLVSGFLATLITPFTIDVWKSGVVFDLTSFENLRYIAEWQPLALVSPMFLIFTLTGLIFVYTFLNQKQNINPAWFLIASFIFALAFVSANFVFYWAAIYIFVVSRYLKAPFSVKGGLVVRFPIIFAIFAVYLTFSLNFIANFLESVDLNKRLVTDRYPLEALKYLRERNITEGLFNEYAWGGFIDWQAPDIKVFIDGRMASWRNEQRESILKDYLGLVGKNCQVLKKYDIKTVLISKETDSVCFEKWEEVYRDDIAKIFVKP